MCIRDRQRTHHSQHGQTHPLAEMPSIRQRQDFRIRCDNDRNRNRDAHQGLTRNQAGREQSARAMDAVLFLFVIITDLVLALYQMRQQAACLLYTSRCV